MKVTSMLEITRETLGIPKVGNLVEITRASIGVPKGTTGLVVDAWESEPERNPEVSNTTYWTYEIQLFGIEKRQGGNRRYLEMDLVVVS